MNNKDQPQPARNPLKLGQAVWKLFLAAADTYAAAMVLYLLLRVLIGNRLWPVALMSTFLHLLLMPAFILLPLMLWRRRWRSGVMLGVGVLAFGWLFGPLFMPQAAPRVEGDSDSDVLTVMTVNVGVAHLSSPGEMTAVLRASGADIIALQELSDVQQAAIERDLRDLYPHQALYGDPIPRVTGNGLLSRYPILEATEPFKLDADANYHMRALVDVDGRAVTVVNAHLPMPRVGPRYDAAPLVAAELASLAEMVNAGGPGILLGDFNTTDQNDRYDVLRAAGLTDAFRAAGWGFGVTWPVHRASMHFLPLLRLDYVWHTPHFSAAGAWVGPETGADHLPVLARLAWRD